MAQHLSHWRKLPRAVTIHQSVIFGFNTDVKHAETVYHVQSEAQQSDTLLQTQVFVGGQCLGKCEMSLSDRLLQPAPPDVQTSLRLQHRQVLECIRAGRVEVLFAPAVVELRWLEATASSDESGLELLFSLTSSTVPLSSAYLVGRLDAPGLDAQFAHAETGEDGTGALRFPIQRDAIANSTLLVEASHAGRKVSSRFLLHARHHASAVTVAPTF